MENKKALKIFESMTMGQIKKLTLEFLEQNPDFKTAEELLSNMSNNKKKVIFDE